MTRSVGGCRPDSKACLSCRWGIKTRSRSRVRTNHGRSKSRGAQPAGQRRSNHCVYSCMIRRRLEAGYQGAGPQTPSPPRLLPRPASNQDRACRARNDSREFLPSVESLLSAITPHARLTCSIRVYVSYLPSCLRDPSSEHLPGVPSYNIDPCRPLSHVSPESTRMATPHLHEKI